MAMKQVKELSGMDQALAPNYPLLRTTLVDEPFPIQYDRTNGFLVKLVFFPSATNLHFGASQSHETQVIFVVQYW